MTQIEEAQEAVTKLIDAEVATQDPVKRRALSAERQTLQAAIQRATRPVANGQPAVDAEHVRARLEEARRTAELWSVRI